MGVKKPKLTFLVANWYSGATLLTILLNGHSQIVSNGEAMFFDSNDRRRYICSCGKYIDECDFYEATARHMRISDGAVWDKRLFAQVPSFSNNPIIRRLLHSSRFDCEFRHRFINAVPAYRNIKERFLSAQLQFFDNAKRLSGASIYLDGTKSIVRARLFARENHCDMNVLHLIRDGRGFCASYVKNEHPTPALSDAARAWLHHISSVDSFLKDFPSVPVFTVRYEDLCRSTAETMGAVCGFLGIAYEEPCENMKEAHILGNRMRKTFSGAIVEDTSWREKFDREAQIKLLSLMKRQLDRFGYL